MAKKTGDAEQSKRFIEAAKKAQADETEEGADRAFKNAVSAKKLSHPNQKPKAGGGVR